MRVVYFERVDFAPTIVHQALLYCNTVGAALVQKLLASVFSFNTAMD